MISRKQVISNVLLLSSATAVSQAALALSMLLTARPLGRDAFGQYAACFSLTRMTSIIFNLGMDTWLLQKGRRGETPLGKLVAGNLALKTLFGALWFGGLWAALRFLDPTTYPADLLFASALATWLEALIMTITYSFNILLRNQVTVALTVFSSLSLLGGTVGLSVMQQKAPMTYVLLRLLVAGLTVTWGWLWLRKLVTLSLNRPVMRATLGDLWPFALSDALLLVYTQADITLTAMFLGKQAAGIYAPASSILRALFVIPSAVYMVVTPVLSQMTAEANPRLTRVIRQTDYALLGIGAALWISVSVFGPPAVYLVLGAEFAAAGDILAIMGAILLVKSCSYASAAIIVATGKQSQRLIVQAIAALINVALNFLLIRNYGINGVAWVYVTSESVLLAGYLIVAEQGRLQAVREQRAPQAQEERP